jgi:restriction endonuclease Mrr
MNPKKLISSALEPLVKGAESAHKTLSDFLETREKKRKQDQRAREEEIRVRERAREEERRAREEEIRARERAREEERHREWQEKKSLSKIDVMTGKDFEDFIALCCQKIGYEVSTTKISSDFGADLIIQKRGIKTVIQVKRWQQNVGIKAVQEVAAARSHYSAERAMVITNSYFTSNAKKLADSNNVLLWDRNKLRVLIRSAEESRK